MPDYKLVIVSTNLISHEAQKHYRNVLSTNGLFTRFNNALYAGEHVDPTQISNPYFHGSYERKGGRRNKKKRSTKHKKRRGKKTRKYRSK